MNMSQETGPEQPEALEPAQPVPPEITGRGRERFSLGRAFTFGVAVFAGSFVILEGVGLGAIGSSSLDINNFARLTAGVLEMSAIFGIIGGLVFGRYRLEY